MVEITLFLEIWAAVLVFAMIVLFPTKRQDRSEDE